MWYVKKSVSSREFKDRRASGLVPDLRVRYPVIVNASFHIRSH
jgi:hypothetical protein